MQRVKKVTKLGKNEVDKRRIAEKRALIKSSFGDNYVTYGLTPDWQKKAKHIYSQIGYVFLLNALDENHSNHIETYMNFSMKVDVKSIKTIMGNTDILYRDRSDIFDTAKDSFRKLEIHFDNMLKVVHENENSTIKINKEFLFMRKQKMCDNFQLVHTDGLGDDMRLIFYPR